LSVKDELRVLLTARNDIIYLVTYEEHKAQEIIKELVAEMSLGDYWTWSFTDGARRYGVNIPEDVLLDPNKRANCKDFKEVDFFSLIGWVEHDIKSDTVFVLRDYNAGFHEDMPTKRALRDFCLHRDQQKNNSDIPYTPFIIISPVLDVPKELEKEISVINMSLPDYTEIMTHVKLVNELVKKYSNNDISEKELDNVVRACQGLSDIDIENALAISMAKDGKLTSDIIKQFKRQIIRKNGQVDIVLQNGNLSDVGGNDVLKTWIYEHTDAFNDQKAIEFGCTPVKGLLLLGHPGTGKTLTAKSIAAQMGLDLIRWDVGRSFKGLVGATENNAYEVLRLADSVSPVVLWIDEIDKALSGTGSSNYSDGGTTNRFYQIVLTWLQEHTSPVFVIATANDVLQLPDALMRAGRFDQVFWVDLPTTEEREEIFSIHLRKRNRDPKKFDLTAMAEVTEGFSGAEIEQVVKDALSMRYALSRGAVDINTDDVVAVAKKTKPLSVLRRDTFTKMRNWAKEHARFASSKAESYEPSSGKIKTHKLM
jgi:ATP-dependent 26S proteasome regulatory subunit